MEFIKDWLIIGSCITFTMLFFEWILGYDRVKYVVQQLPNLEPYTTFLRVTSAIFMVVIWPWNVMNLVLDFGRAVIKGYNKNE